MGTSGPGTSGQGDPRHSTWDDDWPRQQKLARFGQFVAESRSELTRLAWHLCRSHGLDGEDLLQDVLERVLRSLDTLPEDEEKWRAWLSTFMRHLCVDRVRHQHVEQQERRYLEALTDPTPPEVEPWRHPRAEQLLMEAIETLPQGLRHAYRLHLAGLSYEQIASQLGISEGTVGSRLTLARRQLRERLTPAFRELEP